jgi:hypothetical protein
MTAIMKRVKSPGFQKYLDSLKYAFYPMRRPLDGFWDLIHEKRGTLAAANTIIILSFIVQVVYVTQCSFMWINVQKESFSMFYSLLYSVVPAGMFSLANWCLTTLFDGKGRITDIYMGYAYTMVPVLLIKVAITILSHFITADEFSMLVMLWYVGEYWGYLLILCMVAQVHDYSFPKAIFTTIVTLIATGIMAFIFLMFFAVVSDGIAYFYSLGQEALFRIQRG